MLSIVESLFLSAFGNGTPYDIPDECLQIVCIVRSAWHKLHPSHLIHAGSIPPSHLVIFTGISQHSLHRTETLLASMEATQPRYPHASTSLAAIAASSRMLACDGRNRIPMLSSRTVSITSSGTTGSSSSGGGPTRLLTTNRVVLSSSLGSVASKLIAEPRFATTCAVLALTSLSVKHAWIGVWHEPGRVLFWHI